MVRRAGGGLRSRTILEAAQLRWSAPFLDHDLDAAVLLPPGFGVVVGHRPALAEADALASPPALRRRPAAVAISLGSPCPSYAYARDAHQAADVTSATIAAALQGRKAAEIVHIDRSHQPVLH
jgi:hypothetical protein